MQMSNPVESIVTVLTGLTLVAIIAVIVSRNSNTAQVISSVFGGYSKALATAVSPITGNAVGAASLTSGSGAYLDNFAT